MCGITGKLYFNRSRSVDEQLLRNMAQAISHRGPDDEGFYVHKNLGLGFRRLAIIDLSPAGHQPMSNEDGTIWIIFNGEIYNFQELRPDLERRGHRFRSQTDSEVIIHLYEEYGVGCLQYLRGMFAFAIWDSRRQRLLLARDRVGKKPLKYALTRDGIVFASELKSILKDPDVQTGMDEAAIYHYLTLQYVPSPMTGFKGINKLPAAHYLLIDCSGPQPVVNGPVRYWQLDFRNKLELSQAEWQRRILSEFETAVRLRMIADVPLGAFLSGGIDSSAVVAMMAKHASKPIKTFSIGFTEQSHNELPLARLVAQRYRTDHTEFTVEPDAISVLPKLVAQFEEPYADSSALPTYYLSQMTRKYVTVALNGDGGDENFAGYPWYVAQKIAGQLDRFPSFVRQAARVASWLIPARTTNLRRARIFAETLTLPPGQRYAHYFTTSFFTERQKSNLLTKDFAHHCRDLNTNMLFSQLYATTLSDEPLDRALAADIQSYLADDLLPKVDIATMAVSLEARSPFLDHQFMEVAASIPSRQKMPGYTTKALPRSIFKGLVPDEILQGQKRGFMIPIDTWFRTSLRSYAEDILLSPSAKLSAYVQAEAISRLLHEHATGRISHGSRIWSLLTLEHWLQGFAV